jgi:hypothetical protein
LTTGVTQQLQARRRALLRNARQSRKKRPTCGHAGSWNEVASISKMMNESWYSYQRSRTVEKSNQRNFEDSNCGLYCKHITIINDDSRVVRIMLQFVASATNVMLTTLGPLAIATLMPLENIYSTGITYDCHLNHQKCFTVQATGLGPYEHLPGVLQVIIELKG